jgi:hypothetical protein
MRRHLARFLVPSSLALAGCAGPPSEALETASQRIGAAAAPDAGAATITFAANWTESATPLVAGQDAQVSYDPARLQTCRGNLGYGGNTPGWSIDAFYSVNGVTFSQPLGIAGESLLNLHLPAGALPSFTLPFAGTLQIWFQNSDAFGCNAWDSDYGANYRFTVAPPANAPGWVGDASYLLDRATCPGPCYGDARSADGGITFDTWARQQAAITEIFFDVWKSGVTDFDNPDLWKELDVESHARLDPSQPFTMSYVSFRERVGNNARYAVDLRPLDPLPGVNGGALTSKTQCPAIPATITPDGQYVQASLEIYFTINGVALQPSGGGAFRVLFQNYAGLYAVCAYPPAP